MRQLVGRRFEVAPGHDGLFDGPHHVGVLVDADHDVVDCGAGQRGWGGRPQNKRVGFQAGGGEQRPVCRGAARPLFVERVDDGDVGEGADVAGGRPPLNVYQSSEWLTIRSISSTVARAARSGACPPMVTAASSSATTAAGGRQGSAAVLGVTRADVVAAGEGAWADGRRRRRYESEIAAVRWRRMLSVVLAAAHRHHPATRGGLVRSALATTPRTRSTCGISARAEATRRSCPPPNATRRHPPPRRRAILSSYRRRRRPSSPPSPPPRHRPGVTPGRLRYPGAPLPRGGVADRGRREVTVGGQGPDSVAAWATVLLIDPDRQPLR